MLIFCLKDVIIRESACLEFLKLWVSLKTMLDGGRVNLKSVDKKAIKVKAVKLSECLKKLDFLKIDAEGSELSISRRMFVKN